MTSRLQRQQHHRQDRAHNQQGGKDRAVLALHRVPPRNEELPRISRFGSVTLSRRDRSVTAGMAIRFAAVTGSQPSADLLSRDHWPHLQMTAPAAPTRRRSERSRRRARMLPFLLVSLLGLGVA